MESADKVSLLELPRKQKLAEKMELTNTYPGICLRK
jgi:hypothetical protein